MIDLLFLLENNPKRMWALDANDQLEEIDDSSVYKLLQCYVYGMIPCILQDVVLTISWGIRLFENTLTVLKPFLWK